MSPGILALLKYILPLIINEVSKSVAKTTRVKRKPRKKVTKV